MSNLLTTNFKKTGLNDYRKRLAVVALFLLVLLLIIVNALLLVSVVKLKWQAEQVANLQLALEGKEERQTFLVARKEIIEAGKRLKVLDSLGSTGLTPSEAVGKVLAVRAPGVKITNLAFSTSTGVAGTLAVNGVANTRNGLLTFIENLGRESAFATVSSPVGNLIKERDATFTITITLK